MQPKLNTNAYDRNSFKYLVDNVELPSQQR